MSNHATPGNTSDNSATQNNSVIFIHPDGTTPSHYALARYETAGPDGRINWDRMKSAGSYLSHIKDQLTATSNAGAVVHAYGTKPQADSYGLDEEGNPIVSLSAQQGLTDEGKTIMEEAIAAGKATAVINSGFIAEPGTGVFLADVANRGETEEITAEIVESGVDIILGGGETDYLPEGTIGFFGEEGTRSDGRNLIEEAQEMGYTVVYTREQLQSLPEGTSKVLGIFAAEDTYNDTTEEANAAERLENYGQPGNLNPPTVAEMLAAALPILNQDPDGFFVVLEEEGTDNFGNNNNGRGVLEAAIRADKAIGVAQDFIDNERPNTLLITTADSNAGGLQAIEVDVRAGGTVGTTPVNPTLPNRSDAVQVPLDGEDGRTTEPFITGPDENGYRFPYGIGYAGLPDFGSDVVSKTYGLNADLLPSTHDNTEIYRLMYQTLFDEVLPSPIPVPEITPATPATKDTGNVIFIHPDGTTPAYFTLARLEKVGPDGRLNWDMMSDAGVYINSLEDQITATSNAGAVVHAMGTKPQADSYGLDENGEPVISRSGKQGLTIMEEAIAAGKATAVINSGFIAEPGTGVFLADVENRGQTEAITAEILESGVDIILGGGETDYLPEGTTGFFGEEGTRTDGRNLIEEAQEMGYTVVYTREQLQDLPEGATKVLGIFAAEDTYNDTTEEANAEAGLDNYGQPGNENPPTVAEMLAAALPILNQDPDGFMVVLEEEGTDNFGNNNNGRGLIEATQRADDAIGVAMGFINNEDPNTLLVTSADSNAGGPQVYDVDEADEPVGFVETNPTLPNRSDAIDVPLDGQEGRNTEPFVAAAAANGNEYPFGIAYATLNDVPDGVLTKTYGLNAGDLPSSHENTYIYELMYRTLFGQNALPTLIEGTPQAETLLGGPDRDLIRGNEGDDTIAGSVNDDFLYGEEGDDLIRGDLNTVQAGGNAGGDDFISGGLGNDSLYGQGGDDQIYGGEGDDLLFGDAGDDLLFGGPGQDLLFGGEGRDRFALASGEDGDVDMFSDFRIGEDFIVMMEGVGFEQLAFSQSGGSTVISANDRMLAMVRGINSDDLIVAAESTFVSMA
ncbi:alkaline phosphatase [Pseudanabaena sp. FACHB-2040]|uniref:alkaline phosphatase n=1 Tax=Pseudanabaena sp. FACHB-2040 TaxID=2692859 RepID=UPI0016899E61|nr:alkaline phosphatase [Pseudanabaena sp. FACHB-2040]MBD2258283.1 alkaline phosphatase [Pseudanabaena sp. FACHB-2040]